MIFDKANHIKAIDETIHELLSLQDRTASPATIQNQFIGTIIDNTCCLLTGPFNSLCEDKNRYIIFTDNVNLISVIQAVHRSFYGSIHLATEKGLQEFCKTNNKTIESSLKKEYYKKFGKIKQKIPIHIEVDDFFEGIIEKMNPSFKDYLESALKISTMHESRKKIWRNFFNALSIIRNKVSHSDSCLNINEINTLNKGGFKNLLSPELEIQTNPLHYKQVCVCILDFFDELMKK